MEQLRFCRLYLWPFGVFLFLGTGFLSAQSTPYLPDPSYNSLKIRVNLIILQRADGSGNFQDNPEDRRFLENMINITNAVYANLKDRNETYYPGKNLPFLSNAKVEFVPHLIFKKDEFGWNNRNDTNTSGVPYLSGWYLDYLDKEIYGDETLPKAINLYFTNDGQLYQQMVVERSTTEYNKLVFFKQHAASEVPTPTKDGNYPNGKYHTMRCHVGNVWLKLWWKRHILHEIDWNMEDEVGKSIAHELGHIMGLWHTPDAQKDAMMRTQFGGQRDYLTTQEIATIHRCFSLFPPLFQVVDANVSYASPQADWVIKGAEKWKGSRRLYANILVETGAILNISGTVFLPPNGKIILESGATLILESGSIQRMNADTRDLFAKDGLNDGKIPIPLPQPCTIRSTIQGGTLVLMGDASIEAEILAASDRD